MRLKHLFPAIFSLALVWPAPSQNNGTAASSPSISPKRDEADALKACAESVLAGFRKISPTADERFAGKVAEITALCRGGHKALQFQGTPWADWTHYWGTGDATSLPTGFLSNKIPTQRGIAGALLDLEYQRIELIKFNLFDNNGTYQDFLTARGDTDGAALKTWPAMRLSPANPHYTEVGGEATQVCKGQLTRWRTTDGICNDVLNPAMGSTGTTMARNVEFDTAFPDLGLNELTRNRHGSRLSLLSPDPQVISRKLLARAQSNPDACREGFGLPGNSPDANCDYRKAPFFNVMAAYWIQFMTHDWFSHLQEGHNASEFIKVGCEAQLVNNVPQPLSPEDIKRLGCRPDDRVDKTLVAQDSAPDTFSHGGRTYLTRAPKTMANTNTAWWDASQLYGFDERSHNRVKRDPRDPAKLLLEGAGYLPVFAAGDPINPEWKGQEATAFPDNWTVGLSFLHNLFAREHNSFVTEFERLAAAKSSADSGLRDPADPKTVIRYKDVTPDVLFEIARLVVAAEIAKIHTTEWTPQLLYNEPLYKGMNANWSGLLGEDGGEVSKALSDIVVNNFGRSKDASQEKWYSVFASGPGIFGLGSKVSHFDISDPRYTNGGVNHFGSPFNFPEEFVSVYRLHQLVPDLLEYRDLGNPNQITSKIPVVETFQAKATPVLHSMGMANWGVTLGRQRLGELTLQNSPAFLQNLKIPRLDSKTQRIDVVALDIIRDREHGVPRFNEFRRQYGLRQLTSFDDFIDRTLAPSAPEHLRQVGVIKTMREVYGQHTCDSSKVITDAQRNPDHTPITDCLGHPDGTVVDNIEDVDTSVGYLAEFTRPHGFAISETQFVVFILNASRRLFSDRFFTSCFRPEFYSTLGVDWVNHNGPGPEVMEKGKPNGHSQPVLPLKRVLLRNIPELKTELSSVINAFDPWARSRGNYYTLEWKARSGAETDASFGSQK